MHRARVALGADQDVEHHRLRARALVQERTPGNAAGVVQRPPENALVDGPQEGVGTGAKQLPHLERFNVEPCCAFVYYGRSNTAARTHGGPPGCKASCVGLPCAADRDMKRTVRDHCAIADEWDEW